MGSQARNRRNGHSLPYRSLSPGPDQGANNVERRFLYEGEGFHQPHRQAAGARTPSISFRARKPTRRDRGTGKISESRRRFRNLPRKRQPLDRFFTKRNQSRIENPDRSKSAGPRSSRASGGEVFAGKLRPAHRNVARASKRSERSAACAVVARPRRHREVRRGQPRLSDRRTTCCFQRIS